MVKVKKAKISSAAVSMRAGVGAPIPRILKRVMKPASHCYSH